jgi:NADH:ubiquinone oxidoreductase subunit 3 (subunit A)
MPYECGIDPIDSGGGTRSGTHHRHFVRGVRCRDHILFPAVRLRRSDCRTAEMLLFLAMLIVVYIWVWKKGALEWI